MALYRAAQEGLTNVRKHASAHAAMVRLAYLQDSVSLEVRDDGRGLGRATAAGSAWSASVSASNGLGGSLTVESSPGAGVAVRVEVPG